MQKAAIVFVALIALSYSVCGIYATALEPVKKTLYPGETIAVGKAGPGQTVYLVIDRASDGGNCPNNFCPDGWDTVVATEIPEGWSVEPSPMQETPMKLKIKIAPDAADGEYNLTLSVVDEGNYNQLGNMTIYATVEVSRDVFDISVDPTRVETGVGQPAIYNIRISNTGAASDPFEVRVKEGDIPAWRFRKTALVNYGSERTIPYEVVLNEEGERIFTIEVTSPSSPQIHKEMDVVIDSRSNIISDWKATTHGVLIFPILEGPIYAVVGLLSKLF